MKRRIVFGLCIISAIFLAGGAYIVFAVESATQRLDKLITLHQVEILREHYLLQIKNVQSDLVLRGTARAPHFDNVVRNVRNMGMFVDTCYDCHHLPEVMKKLDAMKAKTHEYADGLSRVLTIRANAPRMIEERDRAFTLGEELTDQVGKMIAFTSSKLAIKTDAALHGIRRTKYLLYTLMAVVPLLSLGFALVFFEELTRTMEVLLGSTRRLEAGDLDHRVTGLKDEFGELAVSINEMAGSLKEKILQMQRTEEELARANRELKLAQEQMVRAETMAAIGTLSSGISHELSTPLSVILNMAQLTKQELQGNPAVLRDLEIIEYEANQAIKITRSLLGFARSTKSRTETVDLNEVLGDLFKILEFQPRGKEIEIAFEPAPDLSPIEGSVGKVRQVFLNVILNALQAMPDGGKLRVATRNVRGPVFEGVEIIVSDTGTGIQPEQVKQIFQPFFTTKEEGTGLGLAITYGIVQEHNGRIEVESEVGVGTAFRILLPTHGSGGRG